MPPRRPLHESSRDRSHAAAPTGRAAVLDLVKRQGPVSADHMAEKLGITAMAVRQHLYALAAEGLAVFVEQAKGVGRPVKLWRATGESEASFPDSHSVLAVDLLAQMRKAFGEAGVDKLLRLRTAEQEKTYRLATDKASSLKGRLDALARIREREGYMAEVRKDEETGDWLLVENHCPVCAAARFCQGLCREELSLFRRVLGKGVEVERISHILAGAGRCAYRVRAISKSANS